MQRMTHPLSCANIPVIDSIAACKLWMQDSRVIALMGISFTMLPTLSNSIEAPSLSEQPEPSSRHRMSFSLSALSCSALDLSKANCFSRSSMRAVVSTPSTVCLSRTSWRAFFTKPSSASALSILSFNLAASSSCERAWAWLTVMANVCSSTSCFESCGFVLCKATSTFSEHRRASLVALFALWKQTHPAQSNNKAFASELLHEQSLLCNVHHGAASN